MGLREEDVGSLEDAAFKRKQKLLALKRKRRKTEEDDDNQENENEEMNPPPPVLFRNYEPTSDEFKEGLLPQVEVGNLEELVKDQLEDEKKKENVDVEMSSLAPKKPTFDLRRSIQAQLDRLDRRTDRAIAELIRERLKEGRQQDFFLAVNTEAVAQEKGTYDSDED